MSKRILNFWYITSRFFETPSKILSQLQLTVFLKVLTCCRSSWKIFSPFQNFVSIRRLNIFRIFDIWLVEFLRPLKKLCPNWNSQYILCLDSWWDHLLENFWVALKMSWFCIIKKNKNLTGDMTKSLGAYVSRWGKNKIIRSSLSLLTTIRVLQRNRSRPT